MVTMDGRYQHFSCQYNTISLWYFFFPHSTSKISLLLLPPCGTTLQQVEHMALPLVVHEKRHQRTLLCLSQPSILMLRCWLCMCWEPLAPTYVADIIMWPERPSKMCLGELLHIKFMAQTLRSGNICCIRAKVLEYLERYRLSNKRQVSKNWSTYRYKTFYVIK